MCALAGKVIIVTAGTSGIGARTAALFVANGAQVIIAGRRSGAGKCLAWNLGETCSFVRADVTEENDVRALVEYAVDRYGRLDCLFSNSRGPSQCPTIEGIDLGRFSAAFAVHIHGALLGMKYAVPVMTRQKRGSIITTSSVNGSRAGLEGVDYSLAKVALEHLTRLATAQLGETGIRVNTIAPGPAAPGIFGNAAGIDDATADDIAQVALFLASDASRMVNGRNLVVDGGMSIGWPASVTRAAPEFIRDCSSLAI